MKKRLNYIVSTLLIGSVLLAPAMVLAETGTSGSSSGTSNTTTTADETTKIESENHNMSDRLMKFKDAWKIKLSMSEETHIKLKCVGSQGVVGKLNAHFGDKVRSRTNLYANIQTRLNNLVTKLKAKNVDTTTLEQEITMLGTKIQTFNTDKAIYIQALSDLKAVDCKTDPTGFQAALLAARNAHDTLVKDAMAVRTYLVDTIKPTLQTIKQQLEKSENTTQNSTESSN